MNKLRKMLIASLATLSLHTSRKPPTFNDIIKRRANGPKEVTAKELAGVIQTNTVPLVCRSNRAHRYAGKHYSWGR